jgi:hypothetical protein
MLQEHERRLALLELSDVADIKDNQLKNQSAPLPHPDEPVVDEYLILTPAVLGWRWQQNPERGEEAEVSCDDRGEGKGRKSSMV